MNDENLDTNVEKPERSAKRSLAKTALIIDGTVVISGLLLYLESFLGVIALAPIINIFTLALFLWTFGAPIAGIVMSIVALSSKTRTRADIVCGIIAIAFPVMLVLTVILLFSNGVIVLRFM